MPPEIRRAFLVISALTVVVAIAWASRFDTLPPAEFSLQAGSDPKTLDPARATGNIEGQLLNELFAGLLQMLPDGDPDPETGLQPLSAQPAMAERFEVSPDNKRYVFHLRDGIRWTDGSPVTSRDFAWSWQRMLHPATACEYTYHLYGVPFAQQYNEGRVEIGDLVEVELWDRPGETADGPPVVQPFPRGTIRYGRLREIRRPPAPNLGTDAKDEKKNADALLAWEDRSVYVVDVASRLADGTIDWDEPTEPMTFAADLSSPLAEPGKTQRVHGVLVAFDQLGGLETPDDRTLVVNLNDPIPYFPNLVAFYPLYPVNRRCVETHGVPMWTKADNIVTNGPFKLQLRRLRDRLRLVRNDDYYDAENVGLGSIDFLSLEGQNTALNMYETGQLDWVTSPPDTLLDVLKGRDDFYSAPMLTVYFYRLNVAKPPLDDVRVRRAIALAINRTEIVEQVTKTGQIPAYTIVPPGLAGYESAPGLVGGISEARQLLAEAGFPGGRGIPRMTVLYNTHEGHRSIAEVIQQQLQNNLNIGIELQNMEWGSFLDKVQQGDYQIARAGWIADYPDPNTFLDMWVTDGPQNNTNWSNQRFDQLIADAAKQTDPEQRLAMLREAETIWVDELPAVPIYFYTSINMVKPHVDGFFPTAQDLHPLQLLRLKQD